MNPLVVTETAPDRPELAVLVIPHAGAGTAPSTALAAHAPPGWLVAGVCFGGRESRFTDPPPDSRDDLVADVTTAATVLNGFGVPVVLVGQCSGALVGYLAAAELTRGGPAPLGLMAVSRAAPGQSGPLPTVNGSDDTFLAEVGRLGWIPPELTELPELLELILPTVRADCAALAAEPTAEPVAGLDLPLLAVHAEGDAACRPPEMAAWRSYSTSVRIEALSGTDHLLLTRRPAAVVRALIRWLPTVVPPRRRDA